MKINLANRLGVHISRKEQPLGP